MYKTVYNASVIVVKDFFIIIVVVLYGKIYKIKLKLLQQI